MKKKKTQKVNKLAKYLTVVATEGAIDSAEVEIRTLADEYELHHTCTEMKSTCTGCAWTPTLKAVADKVHEALKGLPSRFTVI